MPRQVRRKSESGIYHIMLHKDIEPSPVLCMTEFYIKIPMEKVRQLLARNRLQLPTPLKLSDSDITVPQKVQSVNTGISENYENNCRFTIDMLQLAIKNK